MQLLGPEDSVPEGEAKEFTVEQGTIFAVRHDGVLYTYANWCPHLGIPLNYMPDQFLDGDKQFIECVNHGAIFEIDTGMCISGPCHGEALTFVPHEIREGNIWAEWIDPGQE